MNEYNHSDMLFRIKNLKKSNKITNEILSKKTNISLGTLSKILAGVTKEPSVESIIRIAQALDTTADYLIFGTDTPFSDDIQITKDEQRLVLAYRSHPELQEGINKMLDIEPKKEKTELKRAIDDTASEFPISKDIAEELKQTAPAPTSINIK